MYLVFAFLFICSYVHSFIRSFSITFIELGSKFMYSWRAGRYRSKVSVSYPPRGLNLRSGPQNFHIKVKIFALKFI